MPLNKNYFIAAGALIAIVSLVIVLFIWPNYRQAAQSRREIQDLQLKIRDLQGQTHMVEQLQREVEAANLQIERELKEIPVAPDLATLIRRLSQEVDRVVVIEQTFTAGTPGEAIPGGKSSMMARPLNVDMEATFDSVFALLRNVEATDRLVRISTVRISAQRDSKFGGAPLVKAAIGLEAIYQPEADSSARQTASRIRTATSTASDDQSGDAPALSSVNHLSAAAAQEEN